MAYECMLPPLMDVEREEYYAESKVLAGLFGIPAEALPEDWGSFTAYIEEMCASDALGVDESARLMAQGLLSGAGSWVKPPRWYRALTAAWLPTRFREEFELPFGPTEELAFVAFRRRLAAIYRCVPSGLRFVGPYHQAQARLANRRAGLLTRTSNRFWIGERLLPFE